MSPFTGKDWRNATTHEGGGDETTPLSAAAIEDLETRVTDYASLLAGPAAGIYNVLDYGAVGNGVTNDKAAIQAAFDAVPAGGGVVYFPPCASGYAVGMGDLRVLSVPNNTTVLGSGYAGRIVRIGTIVPETYSWLFTNEVTDGTGENITFKDLWIDGAFAAVGGYPLGSSYPWTAIRIEEYPAQLFHKVRVEGCTIIDWPGDAIGFSSVEDFVVANNVTKDVVRSGFGGYNACAYGVIEGNEFRNHLDDAIALRGNQNDADIVASHIAIVGNQTHSEDATYFGLTGGGNNGIVVAAAEDVTVVGNRVEGAQNNGIKACDMYAKMSKRVVISGNEVVSPVQNGVFVGAGVDGGDEGEGTEAGNSFVISGNVITDTTANGIRIEPVSSTADLTDISVTDNEIRSAGGSTHGIAFVTSSQTGGGGELARVICSGNRIHQSGASGINVANALTLADFQVDGNLVTESAVVTTANASVNLGGTISDFRVSNNIVSDNSGAPTSPQGISIGANCTDGMVFDNQAFNGHFSGGGFSGLVNAANTTVEFRGNHTQTTLPAKASAATVTLPVDARAVEITGTTSITSVTASWPGRVVTLIFSDANPGTFTDGSNLKLAGNFDPDPDDTITLFCNGTNWYEMGRSVN